MEKFNISEELKAKIIAAKNLEEVAAICNEAGYEITVDDLKEAEAEAVSGTELNEEDLDNVAGGVSGRTIIKIIATGIYHLHKYGYI